MSVDLLDSVNFPRHGEFFQLEWDAQRTALGADRGGDSLRMDWLVARSLGRNTLVFSTSAGTSLETPQGVQNLFTLGGFLNLSGLGADSLSGPHFGIARLVYLRKIGKGGQDLFDVPTYLGASVEAGNVWQQRGAASFGGARKDGSLFLGIDSLLGPLYLGAGYDTAGTTSYYLFLGRTF
jgi:NTE family protein